MYRYIITGELIIFNQKALYIDNAFADSEQEILIGDIYCEQGHIAYNAYFKFNELVDGKLEVLDDKI